MPKPLELQHSCLMADGDASGNQSSYGGKNWSQGVSEGLGIRALGLGVLAELMGTLVTWVPCH